jgi:hypothetical protein
VYERREGTWFAVPLGSAGFALGLLARIGKRSGIGFGYFFGPRIGQLPVEPVGRQPSEAIFCCRLSDVGLEDGEWPVLGIDPEWSREKWPLPLLCSRGGPQGPAYLVGYSDDDPNRAVSRVRVAAEECEGLALDDMWGHLAVAQRLSRLLDEGP